MTPGADLLRDFVRSQLRPLLRERGFRGQTAAFRRERPESVQFVVIDRLFERMTPAGVEVDFDIKLGLCCRLLLAAETAASSPPGRPIRFEDCQVTPPLHDIMYRTGGDWWTISGGLDEASKRRLSAELRAGLDQHGLPWLETVATGDGLADAWLEVWDSLGRVGRRSLLRLLTLLGRTADLARLQ